MPKLKVADQHDLKNVDLQENQYLDSSRYQCAWLTNGEHSGLGNIPLAKQSPKLVKVTLETSIVRERQNGCNPFGVVLDRGTTNRLKRSHLPRLQFIVGDNSYCYELLARRRTCE